MKVSEFGYEYDATLDEKLWKETKGRVTYETFSCASNSLNGAIPLRSGRDALKAVAREYDPTVVLLPALSCDSMVRPFEMYGHYVRFYQLKKDYSINMDSLENLIDDSKPVMFLYMDYFGNMALTDIELIELRLRHPNFVFIEDRTQSLLIQKSTCFTPEYMIASLRKWSNIPDGGLLWAHKPLTNIEFSSDTSFSELRLNAQCNRHHFLEIGDDKIKDEYRKVFSNVSNIIDNDRLPGRMSEYSMRLAQQTNYEWIKEKRRENAQVLVNRLKKFGFAFVQEHAGKGDLYVPILVENRDALQRKLSAEGIFCTIIWPLTEKQKNICPVAKYTVDHLLAVYCDQRMTKEDMDYIASRIVALQEL